jgi:hypothetical protein
VEVIFMDAASSSPDLEFNVRVRLEDASQAGRYTLTGLAPGNRRVLYVFRSADELVKYLEWIALGCPQVH